MAAVVPASRRHSRGGRSAIMVAVIGLCLGERPFTGYHHGTIPGIYLVLVVVAATVTTVSAARGTCSALAEP